MKTSTTIGIVIGALIILGGITAGIYYGVDFSDYRLTTFGTLYDFEVFPENVTTPNVIIDCDAPTASIMVIADTMTNSNVVEIDNTVKKGKDMLMIILIMQIIGPLQTMMMVILL